MTTHEVRERLTAVPFVRFELCLADGRALLVEHPDLLAFGDTMRTLIHCTEECNVEVIDLMLVLSIRFKEPDFTHATRRTKSEEEP